MEGGAPSTTVPVGHALAQLGANRGFSYQEYNASNGRPDQARYFYQVVADDLDVETERVYVRDDDRHNREGQNDLDEFAEVSHARSVALKDLTGQPSDSARSEGGRKCTIAIDGGHESRTQGFDQKWRKEQARPGPDEHLPWLYGLTHVYCIV